MSQTQQQTGYTFSVSAVDPQAGESSLYFTVQASKNFGDADAFALVDAIVAAFPSSFAVSKQLSKTQDAFTTFTTNFDSTPPSFA